MVWLNALGGIDPGLGIKLIVILGFTNLLFLFLSWATCRCRMKWIKNMKPNSFEFKNIEIVDLQGNIFEIIK